MKRHGLKPQKEVGLCWSCLEAGSAVLSTNGKLSYLCRNVLGLSLDKERKKAKKKKSPSPLLRPHGIWVKTHSAARLLSNKSQRARKPKATRVLPRLWQSPGLPLHTDPPSSLKSITIKITRSLVSFASKLQLPWNDALNKWKFSLRWNVVTSLQRKIILTKPECKESENGVCLRSICVDANVLHEILWRSPNNDPNSGHLPCSWTSVCRFW